MFKAVEFPAGIANLDTGLANVDGDALTHDADEEGMARNRRRELNGSSGVTSPDKLRVDVSNRMECRSGCGFY